MKINVIDKGSGVVYANVNDLILHLTEYLADTEEAEKRLVIKAVIETLKKLKD